eukprot:6941884-Pyramimonas_sp.AAC.1
MCNVLDAWKSGQTSQKKDAVPCAGPNQPNNSLQKSRPSSCGLVQTGARHLGARRRARGPNATRVEFGLRGVRAGQYVIALGWHWRGP